MGREKIGGWSEGQEVRGGEGGGGRGKDKENHHKFQFKKM